jgi:hypothetical protein
MSMVDKQTYHLHELQGEKIIPRIWSTSCEGKRAAPKGLRQCLYNAKWLDSLPQKRLKELEISKEPFALFVPT